MHTEVKMVAFIPLCSLLYFPKFTYSELVMEKVAVNVNLAVKSTNHSDQM